MVDRGTAVNTRIKKVSIRIQFTAGADSRYEVPSRTDHIFLPYRTELATVKVPETLEKRNAAGFRTGAFYRDKTFTSGRAEV